MLVSSVVIDVYVGMKTQGSASTEDHHVRIQVSASPERKSILLLHGLIISSWFKRDGTCSAKHIFAFPKNESSKQDTGRSAETFPE